MSEEAEAVAPTASVVTPDVSSTLQTLQLPTPRKQGSRITKINKLVLDGFKSFGKRAELLFGDHFNAILGSNGSGKSNILDSLCFVLGKRSSKELRAEKASNLIYNGGKVKNPAKEAEVSIFFDNSTKAFPLAEDEIKVSRIVKHDGQSKYKINNKTSTRQEILELLGSAKINPDGYNIILQGDIVRLVEMSALDRRMIIEEIAGISVYEEKKQQALNDLAKVEEKLREADIILKERDGYLKELKKDRDQALKHKQLTDNLKKNRGSLLKRTIDKKQQTLSTLEQKTGTYKQNLERINARVQSLREELMQKRERIKSISHEIERQGEVEQVRRQKELENLRVEIATAQTKAHALTTELSRLEQRKQQLAQTKQAIETKKQETQEQHEALTNAKNTTASQLAQLERTLALFKEKHGLGDQSTSLEQEVSQLDSKAEDIQKELQQIRENQQNYLREKDKIEFQLQTIDQQIAKTQQLEDENKNEVSVLKKKKEQFKKLILELNELLNTDSKQAAELAHARQRVVQLRDEAAKMEIKNSSAQAAQAESIAVKKVLENRQQFGEVYGTIAELGQVDQKYTLSLEVAAAQKMQSIVVEDDKTAANAIKFLKRAQLGIATFLPLNKIKPVNAKEDAKKVLNEKGVHGLAIDLIEFDPKFRSVFSHVFGSTLVVDSIETARSLGVGTIRMVTLDGDLTEHSGAMIGGYRHKKAAAFREKGLGEKLSDKYTEIQELETKITRLETSRQQNDDTITKLREIKANLEGDIITTEKTLHIDTGDLDANEKYKEELKARESEITKELDNLQNTISEKTRDITQLKTKKQQLRDTLAELKNPRVLAELNAYEQKRKELSEDLVRQDTELKNFTIKIGELVTETTNATKVLQELDAEGQVHKQQHEHLEKTITEQELIAKAKDEELQQFYVQFKTLFEERNKLSDGVVQLENQMFTQEDASRKEEFTLNTFAVQEASLKAEMAALTAEFQQYDGIELDTERKEEQLTKEILECEKLMATIGAVNLRALDIYDAAEKEYHTLAEKKTILVKEKDVVITFMNEIESRKTELFMTALTAVSHNFQQNFSTLSPKGLAALELEVPEKPFDGGLSIKVKLTGEKFLDIRSLSGGEKTLTALAFLFAIQDHDPAPFYVLDEVDAALDKTNSEKLSKLIRKYTDKAQYVVISHNDALLTEADTLYGVSMNEHGISQVVSVKA